MLENLSKTLFDFLTKRRAFSFESSWQNAKKNPDRACLTTEGKPCKFPFKYSNGTDLTFNECSSLDVYEVL